MKKGMVFGLIAVALIGVNAQALNFTVKKAPGSYQAIDPLLVDPGNGGGSTLPCDATILVYRARRCSQNAAVVSQLVSMNTPTIDCSPYPVPTLCHTKSKTLFLTDPGLCSAQFSCDYDPETGQVVVVPY